MAEQRTFKEAYGVLQAHADQLREQREPNIDDLLKIVTESVDAYKVCKARIEAVEQALEKALGDTALPSRDVPRPSRNAPAPDPIDEDEVPF